MEYFTSDPRFLRASALIDPTPEEILKRSQAPGTKIFGMIVRTSPAIPKNEAWIFSGSRRVGRLVATDAP